MEGSGNYLVPNRIPQFLKPNPHNSTFLDDTVTRRLVFTFHSIFVETQKIAATKSDQLDLAISSVISERYRFAIRFALEKLRKEEKDYQKALTHELYNADILWSLVEFIYLRPKDHLIVQDLIDWGHYCFKQSALNVVEKVTEMGERMDTHDLYWNAVILAILQADFMCAQNLIRKNSHYEKDIQLQQICYFLESFANVLKDLSDVNNFISIQKKVRDVLRANTFASNEPLQLIAGLLIGKIECFAQVGKNFFDYWYELLPAYVLFSCPGVDLDGVGKVAQNLYEHLCNQVMSEVEKLSTDLDKPIFAILHKRVHDMLYEVCVSSQSWWLPVHLCDIFQKHDPFIMTALAELFPRQGNDENLDRSTADIDYNIRTKLIIDYADSLLYSDYWNIAPDYFYYCGDEFPARFVDENLSRLPLGGTKKTEWIYSLALKLDLSKTKLNICQGLCTKYLTRKCYNESMVWSLRSEMPDLINHVSSKILHELSAEGISQLRIFDATSEVFLKFPNLLLLQRFYHFRRCLLNGQASEAATRLYELVRYGMAPLPFQMVLFDQMTKLLDPSSTDFLDIPQLNHESIQDLMRAVNIFYLQNDLVNPTKDVKNIELNAKVRQLRHALCNAMVNRSLT